MLLNFTFKNFKSYRDQTTFTMLKAPRIQDLTHSLLHEKIKSKEFNVLCSSVVYGPNASGKSNIITALNTLKTIVSQGHIRNNEAALRDKALSNLDLVPFIFSLGTPVEFYIEFVSSRIHFDYWLSINLGEFLSRSKREIVYEKLDVNFSTVFERKFNKLILLTENSEFKNDFINEMNNENIIKMFNDTLVEDSLFLSNGFKNISKRLSQEIINWFETKLTIIPNLDSAFSHPVGSSKIYVDNFVNEIAKQSGVSGTNIAYIKDDDSHTIVSSLIQRRESDKGIFIPVKLIESYGTDRIIQLMPILLYALKHGAVLAVDELDVALHPMLMMNIINIFHNDDINIHNAQLIFNTHNPIYLNNSIFRRDEIKFAEKDPDTHSSIVYALSDFGTTGEKGVRNTTDYLKNYFMNKYGAIIDVDYSDIFKKYIGSANDPQNK